MADNKKPPFYLIDTQSAFYKPFGRRLGICIAVVIWAVIESWHRDPFWSVISIACAVYCTYVLFWTYKPPIDPPPLQADPEDDMTDEADEAEPKALDHAEPTDDGEKPKL